MLETRRPAAEQIERGLACAALSPGLRSVLLLDGVPSALRWAADRWAAMLRLVSGREVLVVTLGAAEAEDDLWGGLTWRPRVAAAGGAARPGAGPPTAPATDAIHWRPGRLAREPDDDRLQLVLIPSLALLTLPALRACVTLMDAPLASLQRHGQDRQWPARYCWLAGCARAEIGQLSPHLLDRFALRLPGVGDVPADRTAAVRAWALQDEPAAPEPVVLDAAFAATLQAAAGRRPCFGDEAVQRLLAYFPAEQGASLRRVLALSRLARAEAQMASGPTVSAAHVDAAAALIALRPPLSAPAAPRQPTVTSETAPPADQPAAPAPAAEAAGLPPGAVVVVDTIAASSAADVVRAPDAAVTLPAAVVDGPYGEDTAAVDREATPLRLPLERYQTPAAAVGPTIGTQRATTLHDLALTATVLEAAKLQPYRRRVLPQAGEGLIIRAPDLRSYRRAPIPRQMLVLLLDYTCLRDCDWEEALLPHLQWAYVERARVCLVQVGIAGTDPLRAQPIDVRNVLAPRLGAAFEARAGQATPLAHGLHLAQRVLRTALQHGRSAVLSARCVVVSDGRGNVPLVASQRGQVDLPVGREGIDDSLAAARALQRLKHVQSVLLNPQPRHYPDLPYALADALGAVPVPIPPLARAVSQR